MQLSGGTSWVGGRRQGSFFESFSDLIFGTLVIFIVMVMALALRLDEARGDVEKKIAETRQMIQAHVSPNRFAGGSDATTLHLCHLPIGGELHVALLPATLMERSQIQRHEGGVDPVKELMELLVADELTYFSAADFLGLGPGLTEPLVNWETGVVDYPSMGQLLYAGRGLLERSPEPRTAEALKEALGGLQADRRDERVAVSKEVLASFNAYAKFAGDGRWKETTGILEKELSHTTGEPARVTFRAIGSDPSGGNTKSARRIRVGRTAMSPEAFADLLLAVRPGTGFHVQYVDEQGKASEPPLWVVRDILSEVGFDRRLVREDASDLAATTISGGHER